MKVLVTGSSGMIGTALCEALNKHWLRYVGVDKSWNDWNEDVNINTVKHNLTLPINLDNKGLKGVTMAVLLAANARVYELVEHPNLAKENIDILYNSLELCRQKDIEKVIFASSREVYGNKVKLIYNENDSMVEDCESPYTASKIGGEALVHAYQKCYGIDYIILRYSNVYGRYDKSTRLIPTLIKQMKKNEDIHLWGPSKYLDFTYLDDAISCTMECIKHFDYVSNNIFNIGTGMGCSIMDVTNMIKMCLNSKSKIIYKESRTGEITRYVADISKARDLLGYNPKTYITEGIQKSVDWYDSRNY